MMQHLYLEKHDLVQLAMQHQIIQQDAALSNPVMADSQRENACEVNPRAPV